MRSARVVVAFGVDRPDAVDGPVVAVWVARRAATRDPTDGRLVGATDIMC